MDLFISARFKTHIQLSQLELADVEGSIEDTLLEKLRATHENVCTRFGYIRAGSLQIIKRSVGNFVKQHFNGYIRYELFCKGDVCNPAKGAVYEAIVRNKNALGIHAEAGMSEAAAVLDIIIPKRAAGIQSVVVLDDLQPGDKVYVEVMGKKYQLNDRQISIIGRAVNKPRPEGAAAAEGGEVAEITEAAEEGAESEEEEGEPVDGDDLSELSETEGGADPDDVDDDDETGKIKIKKVLAIVDPEDPEAIPEESESEDSDGDYGGADDEDSDDDAGASEEEEDVADD